MTTDEKHPVKILETRGLRQTTAHILDRPWDENRLPSTRALAGRAIELDAGDGRVFRHEFADAAVEWQTSGIDAAASHGAADYDAVESRDSVFFVNYLTESREVAVTLVLDLERGCGLALRNVLVSPTGGHDFRGDVPSWREANLRQEIYSCRIAGSDAAGPLPAPSAELVGKRAYARYADDIIAEHVYLNQERLVWQGLGRDKYESDAGCDHSTTWKVQDKLYLLTWVEESQPVGAALLMDFDAMRNTGVIFGIDESGLVHHLCGAQLGFLGEVTYPPGHEPAHF
jgi:hypothetical protein